MPKIYVTRWRKRRVVYSSLVKVCNNLTNIEQFNEIHDTHQVPEVAPINVEQKKRGGKPKAVITEEIITTKAQKGRTPGIGRALEVDTICKQRKKQKQVKRLVNYQPRK